MFFCDLYSEVDAPTDLVVTDVCTDAVSLCWNGSASLYKYQYRELSDQGEWFSSLELVNDTCANVTGLSQGHQYEFRVIAVEDGKESDPSESVNATTSKS